MWLDEFEDGAMQQAMNLANLPFIFRHLAIMPDAHQGYGMPIGAVMATKGVLVPNAVGVDIGCGMCAIKTSLESIEKKQLQQIANKIKDTIPVGFKHRKKPQNENLMPMGYHFENMLVVQREYKSALYQLGTLGGGNHFIEIQKGNDGFVWIMVHSGSRNIGKQVATHYHKLAEKLNSKWFSVIEKSKQLAFLPADKPEAMSYFDEMNYCIEFAYANRLLMIEQIKACFDGVLSKTVEYDEPINIAHNYVRLENHFGSNVFVHRKGATSAMAGEKGIIPGSQGSKSYIVEGLGNPESFMSCSHGAGRKLGRNQAQKQLNLEQEINFMNKQGIIHQMNSTKHLDEAASAYKNIDLVMALQSDLVKIQVELKPLAVIKG